MCAFALNIKSKNSLKNLETSTKFCREMVQLLKTRNQQSKISSHNIHIEIRMGMHLERESTANIQPTFKRDSCPITNLDVRLFIATLHCSRLLL